MILLTRELPLDTPKAKQRELAHHALSLLLQEYFGAPTEWAYHPSGAPYLPEYPHLYISISHTVGLVALGISTSGIGIDVEQLGDKVPRIAPRIMGSKELILISKASQKSRNLLYHIAWTSAEALYKLVPESKLISDFRYKTGSLTITHVAQTFKLLAYHKDSPQIILKVEGYWDECYITTWAEYL